MFPIVTLICSYRNCELPDFSKPIGYAALPEAFIPHRGNFSDMVNCVGRMAIDECEPTILKTFLAEVTLGFLLIDALGKSDRNGCLHRYRRMVVGGKVVQCRMSYIYTFHTLRYMCNLMYVYVCILLWFMFYTSLRESIYVWAPKKNNIELKNLAGRRWCEGGMKMQRVAIQVPRHVWCLAFTNYAFPNIWNKRFPKFERLNLEFISKFIVCFPNFVHKTMLSPISEGFSKFKKPQSSRWNS